MKRILKNEINKLIGRFPDQDELQSAIQYLETYADDETTADRISVMLSDWCDEYMAQCVNCGAWHLKSEMTASPDGYFCDEVCTYSYDHNAWVMHAEARAEYECSNR